MMPTLEQIQVKMKKLQVQAEALIAKRAQTVINDIRALMDKHGLTTADIDAHGSVKKRVGRPAGKTSAPQAKRKNASQSTAKGKLPAKYRNPKTSETWSGWARPPAWIKDVKDRSKFLIDASSESTSPQQVAVTPAAKKRAAKGTTGRQAADKTATVKKVAAKKTRAKAVTVAAAPARKTAAKRVTAKARKTSSKAGRGMNGSVMASSSEPVTGLSVAGASASA
jgi:DNA-binding protein H-NS